MSERNSRVEKAVSTLIGEPLQSGSLIPVAKLEELLGFSKEHQAFGWLVSGIRSALYQHGLYLSGEGLSQSGAYEVLSPRDNHWIAKLALARAERDLEGKQTLLINTKLEGFSDLEKLRHENTLRELSMRLTAMRRAEEFQETLKGKKRKNKEAEISVEKIS